MEDLVMLGLLLMIVGFFLLLAGSVKGTGRVEAGGVVMLGPIPLVFGSSRDAALLAVAVTAMMILWFLLLLR